MTQYTPGPSELYFTVQDHVKSAFRNRIPSLSHRSKGFESIFQQTTSGLRQLLGIPESHFVVFTGSATEVWERSIQNLVMEKSFHLVNGAFSSRYDEVARQLGKTVDQARLPPGEGFENVRVTPGSELIAVTHNETSTGVSLSLPFIHSLGEAHSDSLVIVDAVSSLPYPAFDYDKLDSVFFSVQKGFGLPAGLGVWIVNNRCLTKSREMLSKGVPIGTYHSLPSLHQYALKHQTPETPNVLGIYLLGEVVKDFLRRGIDTIRKETEYKAAILYQCLESHKALKPFVQNKSHRSKTVIVAETGARTAELAAYLSKKGHQAGEGYGEFKQQHLRFANFPAHSKEQFESLTDALMAFD
jgi:phosphoserine aminotransferase